MTGRAQVDLEESKAEAARILEMIKTGDPEKAADNLKFLVEAGLISDADRRKNIQNFLAHRPAGQGPALPVFRIVPDMRPRSPLADSMDALIQRLSDANLTPQEREKLRNDLNTLYEQSLKELVSQGLPRSP